MVNKTNVSALLMRVHGQLKGAAPEESIAGGTSFAARLGAELQDVTAVAIDTPVGRLPDATRSSTSLCEPNDATDDLTDVAMPAFDGPRPPVLPVEGNAAALVTKAVSETDGLTESGATALAGRSESKKCHVMSSKDEAAVASKPIAKRKQSIDVTKAVAALKADAPVLVTPDGVNRVVHMVPALKSTPLPMKLTKPAVEGVAASSLKTQTAVKDVVEAPGTIQMGIPVVEGEQKHTIAMPKHVGKKDDSVVTGRGGDEGLIIDEPKSDIPEIEQATHPLPSSDGVIASMQLSSHVVIATPRMAETKVSPTGTEVLSRMSLGGRPLEHEVTRLVAASPSSLEVGMTSTSHGVLKIRAELTDAGTVKAALSATTSAGTQMLHRNLQELTGFLSREQVPVTSLVVQPSGASHGLVNSDSGASSGGHQASGDSGGQQGQRPHAETEFIVMPEVVSELRGEDALPVGAGWFSVRV